MVSFDEVANFGIPALLIIIVLGFLWVKLIHPYVIPMISSLIGYAKGAPKEQVDVRREITYE